MLAIFPTVVYPPTPPSSPLNKKDKTEKNSQITNEMKLMGCWIIFLCLFLSRISFKETIFKQFAVKRILHI